MRLTQRALLIRTYGICFEDMAGDILPVRLPHLLGNIIGNMECHFHHAQPYVCFYLSLEEGASSLTLANACPFVNAYVQHPFPGMFLTATGKSRRLVRMWRLWWPTFWWTLCGRGEVDHEQGDQKRHRRCAGNRPGIYRGLASHGAPGGAYSSRRTPVFP